MKRERPEDWELVEPSQLEREASAAAGPAVPPTMKVPTAGPHMPTRSKIGLAFDAFRKMFRYALDMRRARTDTAR